MEEKPLFCAPAVYRERGTHLRRLEQFEKSKAAYDEALKFAPEDFKTLLGRSRVCADAMKPNQAYSDAELALHLEPTNLLARNMQAQAMYTISDFEKSVVMNHRGLRKRTQPPYFKEGFDQGIETIQDCVGVNAGHVLLEFLPIIKKVETGTLDESLPRPTSHKCRIPKIEAKKKLTQIEARESLILSRVLAMKYLGPMAYDKFFLAELMEDPRIMSANLNGSQELKKIIKVAFQSLIDRQEMLRSQRPYYTIKKAEKSQSKYLNNYREENLTKERNYGRITAERLLHKMEKSMRARRVNDVMAQAERIQTFLDTKTSRTLPDKDVYIDRLYKIVGEAYLSQHRLSYTLSERGNRRRVAFLMGLPSGRPQSYDSVIATHSFKHGGDKDAIQKVLQTLDMCENTYMRCWLQYELARLLCAQKNYALAKFYCKKCQSDAEELGSTTWWLNACFVLMSGDMQQGNTNEVRIQIEKALEWSKNLLDPERISAFLEKCLEMAQETPSGDESKAIKLRERQILSVMDDSVRVEAEVLLKRMSTVPPGRRFTVLPRKSQPVDNESDRKMRRQRGLTIVPGHPKTLPGTPKSNILGNQLFEF